MSEPTACDAARCSSSHAYCDNCDLLVGLEGLHVLRVDRDADGALTVTVESAPALMGPTTLRVQEPARGLWFPPNRGGLGYAASRLRPAAFS